MNNKTIYIADHEIGLCNLIKAVLEKEGFEVIRFRDGVSILNAFDSKPADMLIIDSLPPEMDGLALCSAVRRKSTVPIIIVSARANEKDKLTGLSMGSDDYLLKPVNPPELIARIKSIFRRIELDRMQAEHDKVINVANIVLNPYSREAQVNGKELDLTTMEFNLLSYLASNRNRAVSRSELLSRIWGFENIVETRATDDMIKRVRKKLVSAGSKMKIATVWGYGFKIEVQD